MDIAGYLESVSSVFASGQATEHSYRAALEGLFRSIDPAIEVINEPKRSEGGMPDFLFQRDGIAFGWAEAKDLPKDVIKLKGYSVEQRKRYENAYPNLLYTNGVDFEFIRDKEVVHHTSIADFMGELGGLQPLPDKFGELERQLRLFVEQKPISIRSAQKLAEMMAGKAAIIKDEVGIALEEDAEFRSGLGRQFTTFKENLLPNLTPGEFADIYAETITYGMFAARLHDDSLETFSRQEALEKLPKSNPFLRGLFQYVAGYDIPERLKYVVDDLAEVLRASDPHSLFADFGKFTARNDPFIHFYETFLAAYNPKKRKARGVWYTPEPVVDFIVRAVDDVLKTEFGIADGLADTGKVTVDWDTGETKNGKPVTIRKDVHRVQILDPATGTGTFLAKTVQTIADRVKAKAPGKWSAYVEEDLLPRLHGFELLMASYAMCHMKLDMQLTESGYVPSKNPPRLSVWLTNALEPAEREVKDLFFQQLADEARGASVVKRQTPIMCVIGNPPYSGHSSNSGDYIDRLIEPYRLEPGTQERLEERSFKYINDDYVKFIRFAESFVEKNGRGVFSFITNHGYIANPTFRGMRWQLMQTFDKIYVLELNGSVKRRNVAGDGKDQNVFDIQQGVAIILCFRTSGKGCNTISYASIEGSRMAKNEFLGGRDLNTVSWEKVLPSPETFFIFSDEKFSGSTEYYRGFQPSDLFGASSISMQTGSDKLFVAETAAGLSVNLCQQNHDHIREFDYRPFDTRSVFYAATTKIAKNSGVEVPASYRPRYGVLRHMLAENLSLLLPRQLASLGYKHVFLSERLSEMCVVSNRTKEQNVCFPLYLYPDVTNDQSDALAPTERTLNLEPEIYAAICMAAGVDPDDNAGPEDDFRAPTGDARPSEIKVFDYIYGVLHSPDYRATFAEFLKIDFPRIPYPASPEVFKHVSEKGEQLRRLHLMEPGAIGEALYPFMTENGAPPEEANDEVAPAHPKLKDGRVYINPHQYFDRVPQVAWDFHIGGYQPAQKWLKDRKGRSLSWDDITHYQNIVKILLETDRIMREIELPLESGAE